MFTTNQEISIFLPVVAQFLAESSQYCHYVFNSQNEGVFYKDLLRFIGCIQFPQSIIKEFPCLGACRGIVIPQYLSSMCCIVLQGSTVNVTFELPFLLLIIRVRR